MKKITAFVFAVALSLTAARADLITFHLAITNTPADGETITINGVTRTWKTTVANSATQILTTNALGEAATNLLNQLGSFPITGITYMTVSNTNFTATGISLTASTLTNWSTNFLSTNTTGTGKMVVVPFSNFTNSEATNIASLLVIALDQYPNNSFTPTNVALANYVNTSTTQTVGGVKTFTNLNGIVGSVTNGGFLNPSLTNGANSGNAFTSPGSGGTTSLQTGNGATATASDTTANGSLAAASAQGASAFGSGATASGIGSTALGAGATASDSAAVSIGVSSTASGQHSTAIGEGAAASGTDSTAIGEGSTASHDNSIVIGVGAVSTADNQIALGTSGQTTIVPGDISVTGNIKSNANFLANITASGTNRITSSLAISRKNNTSLANGVNAALDISTNAYLKVSGPSGAFSIAGIAGGTDGRIIIIQNSTGQTMTLANDSGGDPVAANRILTGTAGDVAEANNPGAVTLLYDSAVSRWVLINKN